MLALSGCDIHANLCEKPQLASWTLNVTVFDVSKKTAGGNCGRKNNSLREITAKFMNDKEFQEAVGKHLLKGVYEQIRIETAR